MPSTPELTDTATRICIGDLCDGAEKAAGDLIVDLGSPLSQRPAYSKSDRKRPRGSEKRAFAGKAGVR